MTFQGGGWAAGKWSQTLFWDYMLGGVLGFTSAMDAELKAILEQTTNTAQQVGATITIDDVDVTRYCTPFRLTLRGAGGVSDCEFSIFNDSIAVLIHQSVVSVSINFTTPSGRIISSERFRGLAHEIVEERTITGKNRKLVSLDLGYALAEDTYRNSRGEWVTWGDAVTAQQLINEELSCWGFGPCAGDMEDTTLFDFNQTSFANAREMLETLANALGVSTIFWHPANVVLVRDVTDTTPSIYSFPLRCQITQTPIDTSDSRWNRVTLTMTRATPTPPFPDAESATYDNAADQALKGVMKTDFASANFLSTTTILRQKAQAISDWSLLPRLQWVTTIHPFAFPGDNVTVEKVGGGTKVVRVTEVTDIGGWPDLWSSTFEGREIA